MPSESIPQTSFGGSSRDARSGGEHACNVLDRWQITADDLTRIVDENPSLRGMLFGYVAELKLSELLEAHADVSDSIKYDDHDRTQKGDRVVNYKGVTITIESKSLQSNSIRRDEDRWLGRAQVDASDRRTVTLPDGSTLNTTLLLTGEFDILAVNIFAFEDRWRFVFAKNSDLPRSKHRKYTATQRQHLLASLVKVTWPVEPPFCDEIFPLLDELVQERCA